MGSSRSARYCRLPRRRITGMQACGPPSQSGVSRGQREASVGSVGDSYDNTLAETINGLYKAERIHKQSWKNREAEAGYYQQLTEPAKAA